MLRSIVVIGLGAAAGYLMRRLLSSKLNGVF